MDAETLRSRAHIKSHGSLLRELRKSEDLEVKCEEAVKNLGGIDDFDQLKHHLSSNASEIQVTKANIPLETFVGLNEVKRHILCYLNKSMEPLDRSYENGNLGNDRILLFGETGTGKTHLVNAIATELNANLIQFQFSFGLNKWSANMEVYSKALHEISQEKASVSILLLDNLDIYCGGDDDKRTLTRFIQTVQSEWSKFDAEDASSRLIIIATTSKPNLLGEKLNYGFDRRVYIPTLNFQERRQLIQRMIQKNWKLGDVLTPKDLDWVARKSYAILTSEIEVLVDKAVRVQYPTWFGDEEELVLKGCQDAFDGVKWRPLEVGDFVEVLRAFPTLDSKAFFEFETFQSAFGNGPFMRMYEREDFVEGGLGKKQKKKNGLVWTVFSWL